MGQYILALSKAKADSKFKCCEGEKEKKKERFTDLKTMKHELKLSEAREACVSEVMSLR